MWLLFEFPLRGEAGFLQLGTNVHFMLHGREAVVRYNEHVGLVAQPASVEFFQNCGEVLIRTFYRRQRFEGTWSGSVFSPMLP